MQEYRKYFPWASDDQWACIEMLAELFRGFHHVPSVSKIRAHGKGIALSFSPHWMSTYDFNDLTRLVFLAHDRCIRAEIEGSGPAMIKLVLHKRNKRDGYMHERHPTLEQALCEWRNTYPLNDEKGA